MVVLCCQCGRAIGFFDGLADGDFNLITCGGKGEHGAATIRPLLLGDAISDIVAVLGIIRRCGGRIIRLSDPVNPALIVVTHIVLRGTRAIKGLHLGAHNPAQFVQIAGRVRADGGTRGYFNDGCYSDTIHHHRGTRYRSTGIIGHADDDIIRRGAADLTAKRIIAHRGDAAIGIGQLFDRAKARVISQRVTMIQGIVQGSGITAIAEVCWPGSCPCPHYHRKPWCWCDCHIHRNHNP